MSVGIVAIYPWQAIHSLGIEGPPCASIFTDTRVSYKIGDDYVPDDRIQLSKKRIFSNNLIICYTSNNITVTTRALDSAEASAKPSVKRIGEYLKLEHKKHGGLTELLAVVWRANSPVPQMLELVHPDYKPKPRQGGVGIGDSRILQRLMELFQNPPRCALQLMEAAKLVKNHPKLFGRLPPGAVSIDTDSLAEQSAVEIAGELTQAIEEVSSDTVGYPIEFHLVTQQQGINLISSRQLMIRRKSETWEKVSADPNDLSLRSKPLQPSERIKGSTSAVQLFL